MDYIAWIWYSYFVTFFFISLFRLFRGKMKFSVHVPFKVCSIIHHVEESFMCVEESEMLQVAL